ncbi:MAG: sulfatase [Pirellula sp.]|nr:sulfatase [Pirellula sp.]
MKTNYKLSLVLLLVAFLLSGSLVLGTQPRPPNVVLILADDLGWSDLQCYGSQFYKTPHMDALAKQGVRFTQAYAACHVCSPTRASMMTGKYPARLQLTDWLPGRRDYPFQALKNAEIPQQLSLSEITIAEAFKAHGYRTAHIGKWHLGEEPYGPLQQGFDLQIPRWNKGWPKTGYHAPFQLDGLEGNAGDYLTDRLTDEAERFIESHKDQPFFLYMSHFAVHDPIEGRADLVAKYESKLSNMQRSSDADFILEGNPDDPRPLSRDELRSRLTKPTWGGFRVFSDRIVKIKQQQDNVQFAAMVESLDQSVGRLIAKLQSLKLDHNTIVLVTSDNGGMSAANFGRPDRVVNKDRLDAAYATSNLPLRGAKGWLYEGGIRVPLIVYWPGEGRGGYGCHEPVISNDIYPTLLEMAGLPQRPDQHLDGLSLASLVRGKESLDREAIYWHFPHYSNHGMQSPGGAIRVGDYKLLDYFENHSVQLFNLKNDLSEQKDLAQSEPEKVNELRSRLHRWRSEVGARMMEPNPDYVKQ